ncbi:hypothetical protein [Natronoflexus pectinivorans]|uniref:Outer membrane protein with beta-barrel domain n=1 Tax=Natronoflexus pectinivorans TaxID=682526 RepID=A0A4R2GJ04_9BACT|nr:hypothetical protein [Natronoflexus pectinivorans]TCO08292.1 hypothetical protein EV194_10596 [Natronoflexus pectinivorans]
MRYKFNLIFAWLILLLIVPKGFAQTNSSQNKTQVSIDEKSSIQYDTILIRKGWYIPDHIKVQYAGLIGFMSVGAGYEVTDRYEPTLYYGLLTQNFGGSSVTVHTISLKNSWKLFRPGLLGDITPKAGFSVNLGFTNNTFHRLPAHYPNNYYFQNRIHVAPFFGGEWKIDLPGDGFFNAVGLYTEMSTLDNYVLEFIRTKYVTIDKIWNLSFGVSLYIN